MKFLLVTDDAAMVAEAREGFHPTDELLVFDQWRAALDAAEGADMMIVDMLATLEEPHKVAGYERFARAKMEHPVANAVPIVLISPEPSYEMDFVAGFPNFLFANVPRPVNYKFFRRASTWV